MMHRSITTAIALASSTVLAVAGCSGGSPTGPTTVSVQGLRVTPNGTGVLYSTQFQFDLSGTFPSGTQFAWQFGDGAAVTTGTPQASYTYARAGTFSVTVDARGGGTSGSATTQVSVRSLAGRWVGSMTGHTGYELRRPIPITAFEFTVRNVPVPVAPTCAGCVVSSSLLDASWADNAGCREVSPSFFAGGSSSARAYIYQSFRPGPHSGVEFGIEGFFCNGGSDFYLVGTANATFDRVDGTCPRGGAECRFTMVRQ